MTHSLFPQQPAPAAPIVPRSSPRWEWLRSHLTALAAHQAGTACYRGQVDADQREGLHRWFAVRETYQTLSARLAWLYEHQDDPRWEERDARTEATCRRFAREAEALADWAGVTRYEVALLLTGETP